MKILRISVELGDDDGEELMMNGIEKES